MSNKLKLTIPDQFEMYRNQIEATTSTTQIFTRARARQIAIKVGNVSTGQTWRMGTFRLDVHPGGRR